MKFVILGCLLSSAAIAKPDITTYDSSVPSSTNVQYNCVFENQWTKLRHPRLYPSSAVHWTRQVLVSHSSNYNMWREGSLASNAVKKMAESGGTADILEDIENQGIIDYEVGYDKYMVINPTMSFSNPLEMTSTNRYISVISKMSPSPDWFSGFNDFNAVNEDKQTWYKEFTLETYPYDAGTEDGNTYNTYNEATTPQQPISEMTPLNLPNGVYLNGDGNDVLPVAKYTCSLNTYSSSKTDIETIDSYVSSSRNVKYNCAFENQWSPERHPNNFPTVDRISVHWTKQILAAHDNEYHIWKEGDMASEGVKNMAEAGYISTIIKDLQNNGNSYDIGYDKYLYALDPKVTYEPLKMTYNERYVSAISKLAPSPDWFSGFHDFNAVNERTNTWYQEFTIPIYPFDAGTEDGDTYTISNAPTVPIQPISQITVEYLQAKFTNKVFLNSMGDDIFPVGTYTCVLSDDIGDDVDKETPGSPFITPTTPTRSPTMQSTIMSEPRGESKQVYNKNGLIIGLTLGLASAVFLSGFVVYMFLCRKSRPSSKEHAEEVSNSRIITSTPSEIEEGKQEANGGEGNSETGEIHEREIS